MPDAPSSAISEGEEMKSGLYCSLLHYKHAGYAVAALSVVFAVVSATFFFSSKALFPVGLAEAFLNLLILANLFLGLYGEKDILLLPFVFYSILRAMLLVSITGISLFIVVAPESSIAKSVQNSFVSGESDYNVGTQVLHNKALIVVIVALAGSFLSAAFAHIIHSVFREIKSKTASETGKSE